MLKKPVIICIILGFFYACTSFGSANSKPESYTAASNSFITLPRPGSLEILGVSGPMMKRDSEIETAREDAARKAALYHGIKVSYRSVQSTGSGIFDYTAESNLSLEYDKDLVPYLEKLEFDQNRDIFKKDGTIFIRFTYPAAFPGYISYGFMRNPDGSPEWTINHPQNINGFISGVGFSSKQFRRQDTYVKSYESALADLASQLSVHVSVSSTLDGSQNKSVTRMRSMGNLINFTILEVWIDPNTQAVWTLAIAQNAK